MADIKQAAKWMKDKIIPARTDDPRGPWIGDHRPLRQSEMGEGIVYTRFIHPDGTTSLTLDDLLADDWEVVSE